MKIISWVLLIFSAIGFVFSLVGVIKDETVKDRVICLINVIIWMFVFLQSYNVIW